MRSPISSVLATMFLEEFEQTAIATADFHPRVWLRYMDDTFVIWQHGQDKLQLFLEHLNGLPSRIQFTMDKEKNGNIPSHVLPGRGGVKAPGWLSRPENLPEAHPH